MTGELPARMASNAQNASIWWRHHGNKHDARGRMTLRVHSYQLIITIKLVAIMDEDDGIDIDTGISLPRISYRHPG